MAADELFVHEGPVVVSDVISPLNLQALRRDYLGAEPFRFFCIDGFLREEFARKVASAYPSYDVARTMGQEFSKVNERLKIQVTQFDRFPDAVKVLASTLSSAAWLHALQRITGIDALLADEQLAGAGMHLTGAGGRLDVHVDFNYLEDRQLFRRLNILIYLNPEWDESWGGRIELWDRDVTRSHHSFLPIFNRCVVFETSEISYHGVTPVTAPHDVVRKSFAGYYYTRQPPANWSGQGHSTVFRARPDERFREFVIMPMERAKARLESVVWFAKRQVKKLLRAGR